MNNDLISREALKRAVCVKFYTTPYYKHILDLIDNAPTIDVPENAVNCVLTMFGKCSYNETGCSDCKIKDKIRKALNEEITNDDLQAAMTESYHLGYELAETKFKRPHGKWIVLQSCFECPYCGKRITRGNDVNFCVKCGAKMNGGADDDR